ncbi:MAG: glycosyltransferase family 4 protein [Kiritimatiellae bacterium]|nr:glycosyltransferase family 4 protein [Kiritimatiellia bacterium]
MPSAQSIAFIAPRFPEGATVGGAETLLKSLAIRASIAGCKVTFLTTCAKDHFSWANVVPPGARTINNIDVIFFPVDEDRDVDAFLMAQDTICRRQNHTEEDEKVWIENSVNSSALCNHLREHGERYNKILVGPYLFGLTYAVASIYPEKTILVPCLHDEAFAKLDIFREMFRTVHAVMFNTDPERELARNFYGLEESPAPAGVLKQEISVVGMGFDPFDVDPAASKARHHIDAPYILYSGRREPLKGTPLLIDYMAAFRRRTGMDIKIVLTGTGTVEVPSDLVHHVMDLGFVSEQHKRDLMAGALIFCHPSVNESFGIVILESWLAGTPCLVHAGSAVLRHQCRKSNGGLWFRTYPEFEEELLMLLEKPELCKNMGQAGKEYVQKEYSWETIDKKLMKALGE